MRSGSRGEVLFFLRSPLLFAFLFLPFSFFLNLLSPFSPPFFFLSLSTLSAEAHRHVLEGAKARLLSRIASGEPSHEELLALLSASFPFIGLAPLRDVPLACLGRLSPAVPAAFLQQLAAADGELFSELPAPVRRAVWERDRHLLGRHAAPVALGYSRERATVARALDGGDALPSRRRMLSLASSSASASASAPAAPVLQAAHADSAASAAGASGSKAAAVASAAFSQNKFQQQLLQRIPQPRRAARAASPALRKLAGMVGRSSPVYRGIVDVVSSRVREGFGAGTGGEGGGDEELENSNRRPSLALTPREAAFAALRGQMLMALHDSGGVGGSGGGGGAAAANATAANEGGDAAALAAADADAAAPLGGGGAAIAREDPVHILAWTLDAALRDGVLEGRRLQELGNFFSQFEGAKGTNTADEDDSDDDDEGMEEEERRRAAAAAAAAATAAAASKRSNTHRGRKRKAPVAAAAAAATAADNDAESSGVPLTSAKRGGAGGGGTNRGGGSNAGGRGSARARLLADASLILRDPSTMRLMAHAALRRLDACVEEATAASLGDDKELSLLCRLLQLGAGARALLLRGAGVGVGAGGSRSNGGAAGGYGNAPASSMTTLLPPSRALTGTLLPTLAGWALEAAMEAEEEEEDDDHSANGGGVVGVGGASELVPAADPSLVSLLVRDEVARGVTQAYALEKVDAAVEASVGAAAAAAAAASAAVVATTAATATAAAVKNAASAAAAARATAKAASVAVGAAGPPLSALAAALEAFLSNAAATAGAAADEEGGDGDGERGKEAALTAAASEWSPFCVALAQLLALGASSSSASLAAAEAARIRGSSNGSSSTIKKALAASRLPARAAAAFPGGELWSLCVDKLLTSRVADAEIQAQEELLRCLIEAALAETARARAGGSGGSSGGAPSAAAATAAASLALELAGRAEAVLAATARSRGCLDPPPPASLRGLYSALSRLGGLAGGGAAPGLHAFLQATAVPATAPPAKLE